jgi:hypothetical protein
MGVGLLDDSLLVVVWSVPDPEWASGFGGKRLGEDGREHYEIDNYERVFDTLVDIVDLRTGRLLASDRFDEYYPGVTSDGKLVRNRIDPEPQTEIVTIRLSPPSRR